MIEDCQELAEALGADLSEPTISAAVERFDTSLDVFRDAVAAKRGLTALAVSPTNEGLCVAVPEHSAELSDLVSWGLDVVDPDSPDAGFEYWETLSWENADKCQADLVIVDERGWPANLEQAEAQPTWQTLSAVVAGAVEIWPAFWVRNHADYADALDRLTAAIERADPDLVS